MEKILFITYGHLLNTKAIDFACYLAQQTHSSLTGVFVEEDTLKLVPNTDVKHSYFNEVKVREVSADVVMDSDQSIRYFVQECSTKGIHANVYRHLGNPVTEVVSESRFADLMVIGSELLASPIYNQVPTPFVKYLLLKTECPIIIAPAVFEDINDIVFCYDGSRSSVFAIKQFTYLFPQYKVKRVIILEINDEEKPVAAMEKIENWLSGYYKDVGFHVLNGKVKDELYNYFFKKEKSFVVMGAYGRNMLSNFLRHSSADELLKTIDLPLFIAHH